MPYKKYELPQYPCEKDMWDSLKEECRPIVIYGMGNGADKLIDRLSMLNIPYADIFASDGFVRGHSFRGMKVKSFSEIRDTYPEFVILLSFASNKRDVVDMLRGIEEKYEMLIPDMPIAGVEEYFDREFYNENYQKIRQAYELMADEESKNCFAAVVNYKLFGKMEYLISAYSERAEVYFLLESRFPIRSMADCGAYNGDTIREAKTYFAELERVKAIEPDKRNFKKLLKYTDGLADLSIEAINTALWSLDGEGIFSESGNRNSTISATSSYQHRDETVKLSSLDSILTEKIDYIKYDVEGAEYEALLGSYNTIKEYDPALLVSLYHRSKDMFAIPLYLSEMHGNYKLYLRRKYCLPAWELELIALPF